MKYPLWLLWSLLLVVPVSPGHAIDNDATDPSNLPAGWVWPPSASMVARKDACLRELTEAGVAYQIVTRSLGEVMTPVVVPSGRFGPLEVQSVRTDRAPVMDCELALSLAREAPALSALGVRTLLIGRVHHERRARLGGRSVNLRSRHALGLAVDVRGILTQRGKRLSVLRHYGHPLMQRVEAALLSSQTFRAVVTLRNDPAHKDHFHLSAKLSLDPASPEPQVDVRALFRATSSHAHAQRGLHAQAGGHAQRGVHGRR